MIKIKAAISVHKLLKIASRTRLALGLKGTLRSHNSCCASLHNPVCDKRQDGRYEQNNTYRRSHSEILLANYLLINIDRQYIKLAADDFRGAKVGKRKGKGHEDGAQ